MKDIDNLQKEAVNYVTSLKLWVLPALHLPG